VHNVAKVISFHLKTIYNISSMGLHIIRSRTFCQNLLTKLNKKKYWYINLYKMLTKLLKLKFTVFKSKHVVSVFIRL